MWVNLFKFLLFIIFFFKQKTAYEMCGRDWSSDVCSSDLQDFLQSLLKLDVEDVVFLGQLTRMHALASTLGSKHEKSHGWWL